MKQGVLILLACLSLNLTEAQEWFTSFDVAKRLALIQDKMVLVLWEDVLNEAYPVMVKDKGRRYLIDLSLNNEIDSYIWEHFIPVLLPESQYSSIIKKAKESSKRSLTYIDKLNDDSIKIMDVNMNILNIKPLNQEYQSLTGIVDKYAINTAFLKQDLINYSHQQSFTTALKLASKYIDFTIVVPKTVRYEINALATIYLKEAKNYLITETLDHKKAYNQRIELLEIKQLLMLGKARRAAKKLKKYAPIDIDKINETLFNLLNYTSFYVLRKQDQVDFWIKKLSEADLKAANLILKNI